MRAIRPSIGATLCRCLEIVARSGAISRALNGDAIAKVTGSAEAPFLSGRDYFFVFFFVGLGAAFLGAAFFGASFILGAACVFEAEAGPGHFRAGFLAGAAGLAAGCFGGGNFSAGFLAWGWAIPSESARSTSRASRFVTGLGGLALFAAGRVLDGLAFVGFATDFGFATNLGFATGFGFATGLSFAVGLEEDDFDFLATGSASPGI